MALSQYNGLKVMDNNEAKSIMDGDEATKAVFRASTMLFTLASLAWEAVQRGDV